VYLKRSEIPKNLYIIYRPKSECNPSIMVFNGYEEDTENTVLNGKRAVFVPWREGGIGAVTMFRTYEEARNVLRCLNRYDKKLDEDYVKQFGFSPLYKIPSCVIEKVDKTNIKETYVDTDEKPPVRKRKRRFVRCDQCGDLVPLSEVNACGGICADCMIEGMYGCK